MKLVVCAVTSLASTIDMHSVLADFQFSIRKLLWLGSLAVACRTSDREVAGSTPGHSTAR